MVFSSLVITAATCISGCASIGGGLTAEELKTKSAAVLSEAAAVYDYSAYDLTYSQSDSFMKQALLSYGESQGFFSNIEASYARNKIKAEEGYVYYPDIESMNMKDGLLEEKTQLKSDLSIFKAVAQSADPNELYFSASSSDAPGESSINAASAGSGMSFGKDDSGVGGGKEKISFPIREYDEANVVFSQSGIVNGHRFFGLILNPEMCIKIYNTLSTWFNNQAMYISSGIKGPAGTIYEIWKNLTAAGAVTGALVSFVNSVTGAFSGIISTISGILSAYAPIGTVIAIVLAIIATAIVAFLATAFFLGSLGKGYMIGWEIRGLFNWHWINEELR